MNAQPDTAEPIASTFGIPTFTKIDAAGEPLPATADTWSAIRVTLGSESFEVLAGNVGGREMTHAEATEACANIYALGSRDWRLPTDRELLALVDRTRYEPAVDPTFFPDILSDWYWTSTLFAPSPAKHAWFVNFGNGFSSGSGRDGSARVRAVRSVSSAGQ